MSYNGNGNFQTPTRLPTRTDTSLNAYNAGYNVGQQAYRSDQMDFGTSNSLYSNPNTSKYSKEYLRGLRQGSTGRGGVNLADANLERHAKPNAGSLIDADIRIIYITKGLKTALSYSIIYIIYCIKDNNYCYYYGRRIGN